MWMVCQLLCTIIVFQALGLFYQDFGDFPIMAITSADDFNTIYNVRTLHTPQPLPHLTTTAAPHNHCRTSQPLPLLTTTAAPHNHCRTSQPLPHLTTTAAPHNLCRTSQPLSHLTTTAHTSQPLPHLTTTAAPHNHCRTSQPLPHLTTTAASHNHCHSSQPLPHLTTTAAPHNHCRTSQLLHTSHQMSHLTNATTPPHTHECRCPRTLTSWCPSLTFLFSAGQLSVVTAPFLCVQWR